MKCQNIVAIKAKIESVTIVFVSGESGRKRLPLILGTVELKADRKIIGQSVLVTRMKTVVLLLFSVIT